MDKALCASTLLNMKLYPSSLTSGEILKKLSSHIRTYVNMEGKWIQLNVVGEEQLRKAQKSPDKYPELSKCVRDDLVRRMESSI